MQIFHALDLAGLPDTEVLTDLSVEQLQRLNEVLKDDGDLGRMTWELYQIHNRMRACYDSAEELMSFREEHFHLQKEQEDAWSKMTIAIAAGRTSIRNMGREMFKGLHRGQHLAERVV